MIKYMVQIIDSNELPSYRVFDTKEEAEQCFNILSDFISSSLEIELYEETINNKNEVIDRVRLYNATLLNEDEV